MTGYDSVVDLDREEARSARLAAERDNDDHGPQCRCRSCQLDQYAPDPWDAA